MTHAVSFPLNIVQKNIQIVIAIAIIVFGVSQSAEAGTLFLTWASNQEADIAGYVVYSGTSSKQYDASVDVGNQTSFSLPSPEAGVRYYLAVRAYNLSGEFSDFSEEVSADGVSGLAVTSITASRSSPQPTGVPIVFSAGVSGNSVASEFKWLVSDGSAWIVRQDWSPNSTFTWTPTEANPNYVVAVWARTGTSDAPDNSGASATLAFPISGRSRGVAVTSLTADKSAPQPVGTQIVFTATASATSAVEYKWWLFDGTSWRVAQNWSSQSRLVWTPSGANPNYRVIVRARDASSFESDGASLNFPIGW